jgi:hypothetical protein
MMRDIYLNAAITRVWLGSADDTSDDIITRLAQIGNTVNSGGAY